MSSKRLWCRLDFYLGQKGQSECLKDAEQTDEEASLMMKPLELIIQRGMLDKFNLMDYASGRGFFRSAGPKKVIPFHSD